MKIIIAGAGAVGFHLAKLLSKENQDITLIDSDQEVLNHVNAHLDVMTITGDAAAIHVLKEAQAEKAKLFIAVTTSEKTNLLLAMLAKEMGVKKTIARINNVEYFDPLHKERFQRMGVDVLISPQLLAAQEIERLVQRASFTDLFEFEQGKISVVGFTVDTSCPLSNLTIRQIDQSSDAFTFKGIALLRDGHTLIPENETKLIKGDHIYIATQNQHLDAVINFAGKQLKPIKKIMIIGETPLTLKAALLLEKKYSVTIVMHNRQAERRFIEVLERSLVIHADPGNIDVLKEEGLENMDAFIALTPNSEINIITSLMAEEYGVYKTIALVDNVDYTHISQSIGIDTIINKKLIAANNIFRFVRKGKIEAIASLHGVNAEMIEFSIHKKNRLLKHPIKGLKLPKKSIVAGVIRDNEGYIPDGDFYLELDDKVIILALPEAISKVEKIFM
ncbi:MAG: Trk system potassium transporter TrkA [Saprospiraceae bacterium]|nr:Trk system potassium transporter TrkA [Saprospiraceae bacterium]